LLVPKAKISKANVLIESKPRAKEAIIFFII